MLLPALLALSLSAAPPKPFTHEATVEGISEYRLPNGFKVVLVPDTSKPTVTVNLTVFVGSRHENYGEKGMAHLFEHMLFKETKKIKDVKKTLTELGGDANGTTWFDRTNYFETFPATDENLKRVIELEAERLVNAVISREKLAPEMTVVRNEFEMGENEPQAVLMDRVVSTAFLWHNYGDSTIGPKSDIETVPSERLVAFYKHYYQPDNAMLVVAGKFDEAKTFKWIADTFGKLPRPARKLISTYTVEPTQDGERTITVRRVGGTPVLIAGYHVPAGSDPDYAAIDVIDQVLGDSPSGRLYKALVDTKKAAKIGCFNFQLAEPGYFGCTAELGAKDTAGPAREALLATIEDLPKKKVTPEEVERAKTKLLKYIELTLNSSERVGRLLSEVQAMGDWRMLFIHRDRIKALTAEDVNRVAAKYFKPSNRTLGEYVPTETPDRADIPALVDVSPVVKAYKGEQGLAAGEVFDASPKNIDARTTRTALGNGMKVALLTKKTRGETVHLSMTLRYGTEKSLDGQKPAAEFAARMLMRGTKKRTRQEFKDALDQLKAAVGFQSGPQGIDVSMEVRRPQLLAALDLVAEALKEPAFDAKEFESLRREVLARAEQQKDDPQALGFIGLQRMLSPFKKGHPYYVASIEEMIADATAVKLEQAKDFHGKFYGAQVGFVAVVGDFDAKEVQDKLAAHFGAWTAAQPVERVKTPYQPVELKKGAIETPDKAMAFLGTGLVFQLKDSDADYPAMLIGNYMLGGGFLSGRVPQRLREKEGMSYGAGTFMRAGRHDDLAMLGGYAIYAPQNVEKVEKGFFEEVEKAVQDGFTAEELKQARQGLLQAREQDRADDGALADALADSLDLNRTMAFDQAVDDKLKKLTLQDIGGAMKKYVDPKRLSLVKAGDFKKVAAPK